MDIGSFGHEAVTSGRRDVIASVILAQRDRREELPVSGAQGGRQP